MKSYTDIEQSKKLSEILPLESADMCYGINDNTLKYDDLPWLIPYHEYTAKEYYTPCWSLAALLGVLPQIQGFKPTITLYYNYISYPHRDDLYANGDNLVDICYELILKLNELKLL
jgi:hypothetical protein